VSADYVIWGDDSDGPVDDFFNSGVGIFQWEGTNFFFGGGRCIRQRDVMYRKNAALWCGCSVPAAEWLDSSAVSIAQLTLAAGDVSILCMRAMQLFRNYFRISCLFMFLAFYRRQGKSCLCAVFQFLAKRLSGKSMSEMTYFVMH